MTNKIVYIVTSNGLDLYSAMTRVSLASVRLANPSIQIDLCCDARSETAMRNCGNPLLHEVDRLIVVDVPKGALSFRSRYVKTRLRNILEGPFLLLDSDTLVRKDLGDLFAITADIAAAANRSKNVLREQIGIYDCEWLIAMGWFTRQDVYVNSGVVFFQDTLPARAFAKDWHNKWLHSCGLRFHDQPAFRDQPAFNAALADSPISLHVLPDRFHAQFRTEPLSIPDAAIWHYYAAGRKNPTTAFEVLAMELRSGQALSMKRVKRLVRATDPGRRDPVYWLGKARSMVPPGVRRHLKPIANALGLTEHECKL